MQLRLAIDVPNDTYQLSAVAVYWLPLSQQLIAVWKLKGSEQTCVQPHLRPSASGIVSISMESKPATVRHYVIGSDKVEDDSYIAIRELNEIKTLIKQAKCLYQAPLTPIVAKPAAAPPVVIPFAISANHPSMQVGRRNALMATRPLQLQPFFSSNAFKLGIFSVAMAAMASVGLFAFKRWHLADDIAKPPIHKP